MPREASTPLSQPVDVPPTPIIELRARTQMEEARTVMGVVGALLDRGVSVSDILLVVRDFDEYEGPLTRAADRYGVSVDYWTQLRVTETRLYKLIDTVCGLFNATEISRDELLRPLTLSWVPPRSVRDGEWPVTQSVIEEYRAGLPAGTHTPSEWGDLIDRNDLDVRLKTLTQWVADPPHPHSSLIEGVLGGLIDRYEQDVLPDVIANDRPDLRETEREAQAVTRLHTLTDGSLEHKYEDWVKEGVLKETWVDVAELCQLMVTQRPGSREHSHGGVVDVVESNDVWGQTTPYVIAVGLVDGLWPRSMESALPTAFQQRVLDGRGSLAPRLAWTDGRDRDHFADTLDTATESIILTRHTEGYDGGGKHPSPYLRWVDPEHSVGVDPTVGVPEQVIDACLDGGGGVDAVDTPDATVTEGDLQ